MKQEADKLIGSESHNSASGYINIGVVFKAYGHSVAHGDIKFGYTS